MTATIWHASMLAEIQLHSWPEEFTPGKPHDTLTRMYLRKNCTEIPLLSININCQALHQCGDKQVSLTFHFLCTKRDKIQQIPTWAEASSWFCGQPNHALGKSCYHSTRIQERLMAEVRIPRDWFQTELLGGKHNRSRAKDCSKCEENGIHKGARWNAEVNEEDYGKEARKEAIHAK